MSGPLVPVPELPFTIFDRNTAESLMVDMTQRDDGYTVFVETEGPVAVERHIAPLLAAAILAAAGFTTHRVIDLGGELPEVVIYPDGREYVADEASDTVGMSDAVVLGAVREYLAVLQARAATPRHDERDLDAVRKALQGLPHLTEGNPVEDATRILDALAAARADRGADQ